MTTRAALAALAKLYDLPPAGCAQPTEGAQKEGAAERRRDDASVERRPVARSLAGSQQKKRTGARP